jgi:lipoprotein-anchoring transpeptidase ErfK/SrfK
LFTMPLSSRWFKAAVAATVGVAVAASVAVAATSSGGREGASAPHVAAAPEAAATVTSPTPQQATVPWSAPLRVEASHGTLASVSVLDPSGKPLSGSAQTPTSWTSSSTLIPSEIYHLQIGLRSPDGHTNVVVRTVQASAAAQLLQATVSPDGGTYGIGQPVIVQFNRPVNGRAARQAVQGRLAVVSTPAVEGAWRWYSPTEVHYRGRSYWPSGATIQVTAALSGLRLAGTDVWGASHAIHTQYLIDQAFIATVDVTAHVMTVTRGGRTIRVIKVSTGRDKYPTKGGVHIVLTRQKVQTYDSATVGIPRASPDGYFEKLPWSMRISNGGAFVHANPATVGVQGRLNVSHGCVNTSVVDAKWFYTNSHLGDIVTIIHAGVPPQQTDEGMFDWNYTWPQWQRGSGQDGA